MDTYFFVFVITKSQNQLFIKDIVSIAKESANQQGKEKKMGQTINFIG